MNQGQISIAAAQDSLNLLTGAFTLVVQADPPTWVEGLYWVNTSDNDALYMYNGVQWVSATERYLALLTADPSTSGPGGGPAVLISDLVECADAGYTRAPVTMTTANTSTGVMPVSSQNSGIITFGPFEVDMTAAAGWAALVSCASGTAGLLLYTWENPGDTASQQVNASQSIQVPTGGLIMSQS